jgi:hypothetical protein
LDLQGRKWWGAVEGCIHNEGLYNLYTTTNIVRVIKSRRMRSVELVAHMGGMRNAYKISINKPERKRPLGRPRHKW